MATKRRAVLAAVSALPVALSGCLGGDESTETPTPTDDGMGDGADDDSTEEGGDATVLVRSHPDHGDILVGPDGMTLYSFDADTKGTAESACHDDCADSWPPLTVDGDPSAGDDVSADLTAFERAGGEMQVAANGWPLYYFAGDEEPGDANGQGLNDVWWVLGPDGAPKRPDDDDDGTGY